LKEHLRGLDRPGPVTILEVAAESRSIRLLGQRSFPLFDSAAAYEPDLFEPWNDALRALDYYPWTEMRPTFVHPAFRNYVLQAVSERTGDVRLIRKWQEVETDATASENPDEVLLSEWGFRVATNEAAVDVLIEADD
jgi:hypothetical protein